MIGREPHHLQRSPASSHITAVAMAATIDVIRLTSAHRRRDLE
jgi:hypothetical protein